MKKGGSNLLTFNRQRLGDEESVAPTPTPVVPKITLSLNTYNFGNVNVGSSAIMTYTVSAVGLGSDLYINNTSLHSQISIDNGATWVSSVYISPDGNGTIATRSIKVKFTPVAGGLDEGFVAHVATGPATEYIDWFGTGVAASVIYNETFQSGTSAITPTYRFPTGWTYPGSPYSPVNEWTVYFDGGVLYPVSPGSGGKSLVFANNGTDPNITTMKPFSTVGKTGLTLDISQFRKTGMIPGLTVEWSTDNATWHDLGFVDVADDEAWHAAATLNFPVGAENKANIYVRLSCTADDNGQNDIYFVIDDVIIRGF